MEITSNKHWRQFKYAHEVPAETLEWYDWLDENEKVDGWFNYRGHWYHISDVMRSSIDGWQGHIGETFFSAIVVNISDDGEEYQIGLALA